MKMYLKGLIIILLLMPFVNHAQNISSTLRYINDQFDQYNEYETSFRVDESTKELICKDKFGTLRAKFKDIDVRYVDENIGIYCLNDDKCIRYYDEDNIRKSDNDYRSYTMGLRMDNEVIPHVEVVIKKFVELEEMVLSTNDFVSSSGNGSIDANLRYINQQFSLYNAYETSFRVDEIQKELICEDKFGVMKANWEDIEIRIKGNNFGIYCLNESNKCIRYYDKDGTRKTEEDYNDYTMGLRENGELIPHAQTVLDKFVEIKRAVLSNHSSLGSSNSLQKEIETELQKINAIFQRSSQYNNTYSVNYSTKSIISSTESCNTTIPIKPGLSLKDYKRGTEGYVFGYYFENSDKSILESCTSFEDYTEKTYEYLDNSADAKTVIRSLETIIDLLENNASPVSSSSNNSNVEAKLRYINQEFSKYNAYNTVWKIDYNKKQLIWENNFGTNYVNFDNLEIRADYENDWIGVYCLAGDKCITQNTSSGSTSYYAEYTMSLNDDGKIVGHVSTIIKEFEAIKKEILGGLPPKTSSDGGSLDDPD